MRAECVARSTGGAALAYLPDMRNATLFTPTILLALIVAPGCKDETPANEPGEFGEPCLVGEPNGTPDGCVAGQCYLGYCEENCTAQEECQPIEGWERACGVDLCHIVCDANKGCPQNLGAALVCGADNWCRSEEYE